MKKVLLNSCCASVCALLFALPIRADVLFTRRVYATEGRTYQQIWGVDSAARHITQLTKSERRHVAPVCSPAGDRIWFLSGAFKEDQNTELWSYDPQAHSEKFAAGFHGAILHLLGGTDERAFFVASTGDSASLYRWDGELKEISPVAPDSVAPAALSPDGRTLAVQTGPGQTVTMMDAAGTAGRVLENCAAPVWSADSRRLACVSGQTIRVIDLATGIDSAHTDFTLRPTPPTVVDVSRDGTRLLVRTVGASTNSTSPQSDYWTWEIRGSRWTFVGPGQGAAFGAGGAVVLATPRELRSAAGVREWVSQLLLIDPASHAQTPVAAGASYNVDPRRCLGVAVPLKPTAKHPAKPRTHRMR
jgi:Tol biopolymer transport system component